MQADNARWPGREPDTYKKQEEKGEMARRHYVCNAHSGLGRLGDGTPGHGHWDSLMGVRRKLRDSYYVIIKEYCQGARLHLGLIR